MRWPLAGREAELRCVAEALSEDSAGGVVIAGPAGVGKTRLAVEVSQLATTRGCAVSWVRATRSAASIPLGAFAPLLPATDLRLTEGVELLARARHVLAAGAAGRRLVLCVDDGQLLDDASAALVHQLVAAGEAFATVTVRRDEPVPDALRALWKDELCAVLELGALSRGEVEALLGAGLGGSIDGGSVNAMWELTRGNALFLRELVRHGVDRGLLAEHGGLWRWRGKVEAGTRLAELVDLRIDGVGPSARGLLELVAAGGPLELGLLVPAAPAALDVLERSELVVRRTDGRRRFVDVGHPLHGEAVRARLTTTRLEAIHVQLANAVQSRGARRGGDLLRVATWRLESGAIEDGALFARAAFQALAAHEPVLAERLARAAVQAGAGLRAELALGRALAASGRGLEADPLLADLAAQAGDDRERAAVAMARARNLFWALDRADDADAVLQGAEHLVRDDGLRHELTAQRVRLTAAHGRPQAALAAARPLLHDGSVHERARTTAALGAVEALFTSGRTDEAVALAEASLPAARRCRDELPHAEPVLLGMRAMALRLAGRLVAATTLSQSAYALLLPRRSASATAVEANSLGLIWLARGRVRTALRLCRESAALLRDGDAVGMLAFALASVGQAAAQAGEPEAARGALAEMERTPLGHKAFAVELELARAWSAVASGELSRARESARGGRARTIAWPGRLRRPRAARALPAGRPGHRRALARPARRPSRRAVRRDRGRARRGARRPRRARPDRGRRALRRRRRAARGRRGGGRRSRRAPRRRPALERPHCRRARRPLADDVRGGAPADDARRAGDLRHDAARARDRAARGRRREQPRDRRPARDLRAHGRQPSAERVPQARRHTPPGPAPCPQPNALRIAVSRAERARPTPICRGSGTRGSRLGSRTCRSKVENFIGAVWTRRSPHDRRSGVPRVVSESAHRSRGEP